ncbi:Guanine nucleotide exchange factor for Cdc42p [Microsporum audouinii]
MEVMNGSHIMAEDNIINRRGGESLFQNCSNLKKRLAEVPGFEPHLAEMQELDRASEENDPVASVWKCLRQGYPLMTIYNATNPSEPLSIDENKLQERNRPKAATFKFLQACLQELNFPQQECFLITDLYGDSTTGFVKVIKMVNRVIDILELQGQLYKVSPSTSLPAEGGKAKLTQREHILKEMLETERDYVHHLQNLQALKKELDETGALTGDTSHQIFLNLNNLLDFAQRFLIRMEQHNALPEEAQNWGDLYLTHRKGFLQYEPFIANQLRCDQICQKEWDKIHTAPRSPDLQQMVAQLSTLNGFFVKPFQRLTKYPLMLMELRKQTENPALGADISEAINMIQLILDNANHAIDKEHLVAAVEDLSQRVEDWKALKIEKFGDLLRYGTFTILKGDSSKDAEREVRIILSDTNAQSTLLGSRRSSFTGSVIHLLSANSPRNWSWKQPKDLKSISTFSTPIHAHPLELLTPDHSASTKTLEFNTPSPGPGHGSFESCNTSPSKSRRSISSIFSLSKNSKQTLSPTTSSMPQQNLTKALVQPNSEVESEDER